MRVSARGYTDHIKASLSRPSARIGRLYAQLTSAKRLNGLSDDPLVATRVVRAHTALTELDARRFVIDDARRLLGGADGALGDMGQALQRCYDLGLRALTPHLGADERRALAQEVRHLSATIRDAGNLSVQDTYVFSGTMTDTAPFRENIGGGLPVTYHGNHQALSYQVSPSEMATVGFTGAEALNYPDAGGQRPVAGVDADAFSLLRDLADSIEGGELGQVEALSGQVKALHGHVVGLRGQVGVMVQRYDAALSACDATETRLRELLSADEDLDMADAIVTLSTEESAYQAVLGMTSRLLALPDLFDGQW